MDLYITGSLWCFVDDGMLYVVILDHSADESNLLLSIVLFGHVGDKIPSRRMPFILGLGLVFLSTVFFAFATRLWALLTARTLQGLSTAMVYTVGYTLLTEVVGMEHLGKAMGYTSMALSFGLMIGPVLGGVLYDYCGYFQVYLPAFGLIAMEVVLRLMIIEKEKKPIQKAASPPALPKAGQNMPSADPDSVAIEPTSNDLPPESKPLLQSVGAVQPANAYKALLTSPRFLVALASLLILNSISNGFDSTLTPYIQDTFDMHATQAAALFLALAAPMVLAPISGWLTDRYGPQFPIITGLVIAIPSLSLLSMIAEDTALPFPKLAILLGFVGLAFALVMGPLRVEANLVVYRLDKETPGGFGPNGILARAIGLTNTVVAGGGMAGPLYAGFVRVAAGWKTLELVNAGLCAGIVASCLLSTCRRRKKTNQDEDTVV